MKSKKRKRKSASSFYFLILGIYLLFSVTVVYAGLLHKNPDNFKVLPIHQQQALSGEGIEVISRAYNPKNKTYQLNVYISDLKDKNEIYNPLNENNAPRINDSLSVKAVIKSDHERKLKTKVVRVTPSFYSIFVSNVPESYHALRTELTLKTNNEALNASTDEESLRIYSLEKKTPIDKEVSSKESIDTLETEALDEMIWRCKTSIKDYQKEIEDNQKMILSKKGEIHSLENELTSQISSEKKATMDSIQNIRSEIDTLTSKIKEDQHSIQNIEKKISLLQKQKAKVQSIILFDYDNKK